MNYEINRNEIKALDKDFRRVSSRFLRTKYGNECRDLKRFLSFIDNQPILRNYIDNTNTNSYDIKSILDEKHPRDKYDVPVEKNLEITWIYQLLSYVNDNQTDFYNISQGYGNGNRIQNHIDAFCNEVLKPFVDHIVDYIFEVMTEMGFEDNASTIININANQSQVNVANDKSSIGNVNQNININESKKDIIQLIEKTKSLLLNDTPNCNDRELAIDDLEVIQEQIESSAPKQTRISRALSSLKSGSDSLIIGSSLLGNVIELSNLLKPIIDAI